MAGLGVQPARAAADAFAGLGIPRQQALWQVRALRAGAPVLDAAAAEGATLFDMSPQPLPAVAPLRSVAADYAGTGLSLRDHPVRFLRESLARRGAVHCAQLRARNTYSIGNLNCTRFCNFASNNIFSKISCHITS